MTTWQPIETAPKDGTWILGGCIGVDTEKVQWSSVKSEWVDTLNYSYSLTHWQPLPEAPK